MSKYFHLNIVLLIKASLPEATFQKICLLSLYLCWMGTLLLLEVCYFEMVSVSGKFQEILAQELSPRSFDLRQPFSLKLEESRSSFAQFFTKITVVIVIILFLQILQQYFIESIYLSTRTNVTLFFFRRYLAQSPSHGSLLDDSLDQRLSADLELFSRSLVTLFPHVSIWPLSVSYYLYLNFKAMNWYGTFAIITHFGLSSAVISCLSSKISTLTVLQLKYSGNFRSLITIIHRKFEANFLENSLTALQRWATLVFFQWHATYKNFIGWKCLLTGFNFPLFQISC